MSTTPKNKSGVASAIFKMASTLVGAFGIAIIVNVVLLIAAFIFALVVIPKVSVKNE